MPSPSPVAIPTEILLLSPRPDTDPAFEELAARLVTRVAPVPVRVIHGDGSGDPAPRPGAALITGGQPGARVVLDRLAGAETGEGWRWVHLTASGTDALEAWGPIPGDPLLTHSRGVNARSIAEWALAAILHFARDFDHYGARAVAPSGPRWDRRWARELSGLRLLVVGAGSAGGELARLASALGMSTVGVSRSGDPGPAFDRGATPGELDEELGLADVTVVLLPLSDETRGSFGPERIGRLKAGSLLLAASRGGIVDEAAVLEAVRSGRLRGAAFDVFGEEPLPDDHPFWSEPGILVTPHVAGTTDRFMERTAGILAEIWTVFEMGAVAEGVLPYLVGGR